MLHDALLELQSHLNQRIIGQPHLIDRLLLALLCDGHMLVEGAPGLAKTTAVKELAACLEGNFQRIQFTPDLLPADLTGTDIYRPQEGSFYFQEGPLFHNIILADEINRAPAKVQSALLEAMAERQITIGNKTYSLEKLFFVMATQNPIEQEGTYPLPEAQLDRFLFYTKVDYPDSQSEQAILQLNRREVDAQRSKLVPANPFLLQEVVFKARDEIARVHMTPDIEQYIVQLVMATRQPEKYSADLRKWIRYGVSPRGTIGLDRTARAHAWLQKRDYVTPKDIHAVIYDVLRHRLLLSFHAEAQGITTDRVIEELLGLVAIP
jgi:MoxR-like ATPase